MRQKLYGFKLRLRHYIDQTRPLVEENQRLLLNVQATSSALDDRVQQEDALSQFYEYRMGELKVETTSLREELARTRQELQAAQGAESELVKYANTL